MQKGDSHAKKDAEAGLPRPCSLDLSPQSSPSVHPSAQLPAHLLEGSPRSGRPIARPASPLIASVGLAGHEQDQGEARCAAQGGPGDQLRELVTGLDPARAIAALLTLGWSAALRRSELVGLDWRKQSDGRGIVEIVDKGIRAVLATSKGSQEGAVEIPVPSP